MGDEDQEAFGSIGATHRLWLFCGKHVELLSKALGSVSKQNGDKWTALYPPLYSALDSCDSVCFLSQQGKVRDCFVISRTIFETIVNSCFICAGGDEVAKRARRHFMQKSYRDLHRELEINNRRLFVGWNGKFDLSSDLELQAALAEYTNKKGREITAWTPETVKEQVEAIEAKYGEKVGVSLQFGLLSIYRHASEIAHGTLFGSLFSLGLTTPSGPIRSPDELANHQRQNISMLLMMLGLAISAMLHVLAQELPLSYLVKESDQAISELRKEGWAASLRGA